MVYDDRKGKYRAESVSGGVHTERDGGGGGFGGGGGKENHMFPSPVATLRTHEHRSSVLESDPSCVYA